MIEEAYEKSEAKGRALVDAVKHALIANEGLDGAMRLYPEWFYDTDDITDEDIENSAGTWIFPDEATDMDDIESVLRNMGQGMSVSGVDTERLRAMTKEAGRHKVSNDDGDWI